MTLADLSAGLASRGLLTEDRPLTLDGIAQHNPSPWYVQAMVGVCAWIAGLLLALFVVLFVEVSRAGWSSSMFLGICACAVAAAVYAMVSEDSAFGSQFALAMSLGGQIGIAISFAEMRLSPRTAIWTMLLIEVALIFIMRNRLHRILSSVAVIVAWALGTHELLFRELPGISIFQTAQAGANQTSLLSILLWMAVWAPVAFLAFWLVKNEAQWMAAGHEELLRPVTYGLIAALSIAPLATHPATFWLALGFGSARELTDGSLQATSLWPLLAMFLAILGLGLAFALRNRALAGLSIVFALLEVSSFYYVLGTTLLVKSVIMVALGAALIASTHWLAAKENT